MPYEKVGKNEPVCIADEVPFEIPESWEWTRLGLISSYAETKKKIKAQDASPDLWQLDLEDIEKGGRILEYKTVGERKAIGDKTFFEAGNVLYSKLRPYLLKVLVAPADGICTPEIVPFSLYGNILPEYVVAFLKSPYVDGVINAVTYGVKMPRVGTQTMTALLLPLPPLNEQQRIVDKINEVMPIVAKYDTAYSKVEELNETFPEALRRSILQWAVQGKLVPQDPADEPAQALLERIKIEKQRLINEGKIKKDKHESIIFRRDNSHYEKCGSEIICIDDEIPFEIPHSWGWVRLNTISKKITDGEHKTPRRINKFCGYYLLSARNVRDGELSLSTVDYVDKEEFDRIAVRCNPQMGDVLISCSGSIGRCCVVADKNNYVMVRSAAMVSPIFVQSDYLMLAIQSECVQQQIREKTKQAVQANLFQEAIRTLLVPIPPISEQKRIVTKYQNTIAPL